jgi:hypothetical protein
MMRDELLKQISALPPDADIGIQIGDDHLDIADLAPWGDGGFVALTCHSADLRDVLSEWGLPVSQRQWLELSGRREQPVRAQQYSSEVQQRSCRITYDPATGP